tara:strand:- start:96 stop:359 length:264 start_codon:yes stop_codon:yes gene_type:complete
MIELNFLLLLAVGLLTFYNIVMLKKHVVNFYNRLHILETRLNYHEVALAHNDIVPMPWEIEELEKIERELDIKKEGNVVYINREETE